MLCICAPMASTISAGHPSARAAKAVFSMTCSLFFSLLLAVSMRQLDIASKAAFTALRASPESPNRGHPVEFAGRRLCELILLHGYGSSLGSPERLREPAFRGDFGALMTLQLEAHRNVP